MSDRIVLRPVTPEEKQEIRRLARSQTAPIRQVQRARIVAAMLEDPALSATAAGRQVGLSNAVGGKWVRRFNEGGLEALEDQPRSGRPAAHPRPERALEAPGSGPPEAPLSWTAVCGRPFALWTLERLQEAFFERAGIHLATSTIWEYVEAEGLSWKRQQSWFHEAKSYG